MKFYLVHAEAAYDSYFRYLVAARTKEQAERLVRQGDYGPGPLPFIKIKANLLSDRCTIEGILMEQTIDSVPSS